MIPLNENQLEELISQEIYVYPRLDISHLGFLNIKSIKEKLKPSLDENLNDLFEKELSLTAPKNINSMPIFPCLRTIDSFQKANFFAYLDLEEKEVLPYKISSINKKTNQLNLNPRFAIFPNSKGDKIIQVKSKQILYFDPLLIPNSALSPLKEFEDFRYSWFYGDSDLEKEAFELLKNYILI